MGIEIAAGVILTWQAAVTIASIAYQISQARKMKRAAAAAAEARKGFELTVEGEAVHLPLVYGRAKIGGIRVYHNVANSFNYVTPNSDKEITTNGFNGNLNGQKNEYLFFQQALCQGPINAVYDVAFDESRYFNDSDISNSVTRTVDYGSQVQEDWVPNLQTVTDLKSGFRIDLHYGNTPVADNIMAANFSERKDAKFTVKKDEQGFAYASVVIKLNRDQPQFNGVPQTQFFIEGRKIFSVIKTGSNYSLSTTRTYSNNPALVLLDYLIDTSSGKSLSIDKIDLKTFYDAAEICNTIVQPNSLVGGKIWQTTDGTRNISSRSIPLYECNIIIDTEKPIRENVESILSSMGDARLVWSGGKYKLNLQYPSSNSAIQLATTLTDDDLVLDDNVQINWPSASERLNQCTVRFHNESENFKEDTVSWPPKTSGTSLRGIGGFKYPVKGNFETDTAGGQLLNSYAVWSGSASSTTLNYKFIVKESGTYTLDYTADDNVSVTITNINTSSVVLNTGVQGNLGSVKTATVPLTANTVYAIQLIGGDTGGEKGVAAKLTKDNFNVWTTRSDAYTNFVTTVTTSTVYDTMKAEDGGLELETDLFAEGITDYYHALAKAEELVRTSRSAFGITFKYIIKNNFLEPGDFIRLNSKTLKLGETTPIYLRVNQVKVSEESTCEITATRFDYTQLAWNVKDDEYLKPSNAYNFNIDQPRNLVFTPESVNILSSVGTLNWDDISSPELASYIVYMYKPGNVLADGTILWTELGRSIESQFTVPALTLTSVIFGVRAVTKSGKLSEITTTGLITLTPATAATAYILQLSNDSISLTCDRAGVPVTGQLPKTVTIKVTKGDTVYNTGVTYAITATGCTATLTGTSISITAVASQFAKIVVTATIGTLVLTKEISISKSFAGASITGFLTNSASTVPAGADGIVPSFTGTGGTFKVFDGLVDKTGDVNVTYSIASSSGVTIAIASSGDYTISAMPDNVDSGTATLRAVYGGVTIDKVYSIAKSKTGAAGNKSIAVYLYQWAPATTTPGYPTGESTYTWSTSSNAGYTGTNNWQTTVPTNPGTPLLKLWVATKTITALSTALITNVDWTTNVNVAVFSQNGSQGISGLNNTRVRLYQAALTIPTPPSGSSMYTWATGSYSYTGPYGWETSPPVDSTNLGGQTLWVATVNLSDSASNPQTEINWATAAITAESYYGTASTTPGPSGASARIAYAVVSANLGTGAPNAATTPSSTPNSLEVSGDNLPTVGTWFPGITWQSTAPASLSAGQYLYQVDGLYNPATTVNKTTWFGIPYLSSLKVGNLSAITANTGQLIVNDTIQVGTTGVQYGTNGVFITVNGIEIWNGTKLRVKLGLL